MNLHYIERDKSDHGTRGNQPNGTQNISESSRCQPGLAAVVVTRSSSGSRRTDFYLAAVADENGLCGKLLRHVSRGILSERRRSRLSIATVTQTARTASRRLHCFFQPRSWHQGRALCRSLIFEWCQNGRGQVDAGGEHQPRPACGRACGSKFTISFVDGRF